MDPTIIKEKQNTNGTIVLKSRNDRLGSNLIIILSQLIFAHKHNLYIKNNLTKFPNSIFIKSILEYCNEYNLKKEESLSMKNLNQLLYIDTLRETLKSLRIDFLSYIKNNQIYSRLRYHFEQIAKRRKYTLPFDPEKTICIHLRLEDSKNKPDYNSRVCSNYYKQKINNNIWDYTCDSCCRTIGPRFNTQAPLSNSKLIPIINKLKEQNPGYNVVIITSPNEKVSLPYPVISSVDPNYDLYLLCNAKVLVLSRSNFAMAALFFGIATEIYAPQWVHLTCLRFGTKYDNSKLNYFY